MLELKEHLHNFERKSKGQSHHISKEILPQSCLPSSEW